MAMGSSNSRTGIFGVLRRLAEGASLRPLDAAEHGPEATADATLASLLDLGGTVRLADHLSTRRGVALDGSHAPTSPFHDSLARKVTDVREDASSAFAQPFAGRRAMPNADAMMRVLKARDALTTRDETAITEAMTALAAQARERFDHHFAKGRQRIRWIRTDITPELRALGTRAAILEVFDAVLTRSLEGGFVTLYMGLADKLDVVFVARMRAAILALPEDATDVSALFAPGGAMPRYASELDTLLRTVIENELDAVLALADTAYALRHEEAHA